MKSQINDYHLRRNNDNEKINELRESLDNIQDKLDQKQNEIIKVTRNNLNLMKKVSELESIIKDLQKLNEAIISEKSQISQELYKLNDEKDDIILSYESKLNKIQIEKVEYKEQCEKHLKLTNKLRIELEDKNLEISTLTNKLKENEYMHTKVQQEETQKLIFDQQEKLLNEFRKQIREEVDRNINENQVLQKNCSNEKIIDEEFIKILKENGILKNQVTELESSIQEMQIENDKINELLNISKQGWSPSLQKFEALSNTITKLEKDLKDREGKLSVLLLNNQNNEDFDQNFEISKLLKLLDEKDLQILKFKHQMDDIILGISKLKMGIKKR